MTQTLPSRRQVIHRWIRRIWVTAGLSFLAWMIWNAQAHGVPASMRESDDRVTVTSGPDGITLRPTRVEASKAPVVFLPGGGVDPVAYIPLVRSLAEAGHPVDLVFLPWRMAFTESAQQEVWRRIRAAASAYSTPVVLAGHSRGAALAAKFAATDAVPLAGLVLIGTTHPRDEDLSPLTLPVLKILGSRDCVASPEAAAENRGRLPSSTDWIIVEGANHAQFGYYGSQLGDCAAEISRQSQQQQVSSLVLNWTARLHEP